MERNRGSGQGGARVALAGVLALAMGSALFALDLSGRTDTGYRLGMGDGATLNGAWNTHSLELGLGGGLRLSLYGGLDAAFGSAPAAGTVLISLPAARNGGAATWFDYNLYSAAFEYDSELFGLRAGRLASQPGAALSFDGLSLWVQPLSWLRIEAFGGLPFSDASLIRVATGLSSGDLEGGALLTADLLEGRLGLSGGYVYLKQNTATAGTIAAATEARTNQVVRASASWMGGSLFSAGAAATLVDFAPLAASLWAGGSLDALHLSYTLNGDVQLVDASGLGESFSDFAAILGSAKGYLAASASLSENLLGFMPGLKPFKALSLDLAFDHRQSLGTAVSGESAYEQFRVGPSLAFDFGLAISGYYNLLIPQADFGTNISAFGGELREKFGAFDLRLGTSFTANDWESDPTGMVYTDSFAAQQYYLRAGMKVTKALDLQVRASYESSKQTSIVDAFTGLTDPNASPRTTIRAEIRAGYRY